MTGSAKISGLSAFGRFAFAAVIASLLWSPPASAQTSDNAPRPNFVVIFVDDMGWGDLSSSGAEYIETPHIDSIGTDGLVMSQFYAGSNVCSPSRAALLTGRYAPRSGMQFVTRPHSDWGLPSEEITIAEMLRNAGYATGMIGKWHLGHRLEYWPTQQGFESFLGVPYSNDQEPFNLYRGTRMVEREIDQTTLEDTYATEAERFIADHAAEPFFLYYATNFPHRPLFFPPENTGRSGPAGDYGDTIETLDDAVGRILAALDENGLRENTLVIFTSDNGPWFQGSSGPFKGHKGDTNEGGYRVPFLLRWPAGVAAGTHNDAMSMSIDMLPTFAQLAGAQVPQDRTIDGRDVTAMWTRGAPSPHEILYFINNNGLAAVRSPRFKLLLSEYYRASHIDFRRYTAPKLFDMLADPQERYDIANRYPGEYERLLALAEEMSAEIAPMAVDRGGIYPDDPTAPLGPILDGDR
ncbi:sulfatase [Aurantiacibacter rhizosphaerae]|uniref:Sulfatase-like hydrolase/transferase n=1 Tax=Aurantiacibacter rhizosphaerae TaxID=2691582 RepID=A0A844XH92_9SPHN|nr:sulfatase [Aurantiacibacter rhizosphaerae]MWV29109.1 sulfatase-like hydrolase/transferase [Aurantiacibacter rhizosphaerae]